MWTRLQTLGDRFTFSALNPDTCEDLSDSEGYIKFMLTEVRNEESLIHVRTDVCHLLYILFGERQNGSLL